MKRLLLLATVVTLLGGAVGLYHEQAIWEGTNFFNNFNFFTGNDPTHGYVNFVTSEVAFQKGLVRVHAAPSPVYMGVDNTSVASGRGRDAVRLSSKTSWTVTPSSPSYLFVLDINHMPTGCGTWPAWWFVGPSWPTGGEIDVVEGVNLRTANQYTLHTSAGCSLQNGPSGSGTRTGHPSCASSGKDNAGCGITGAYGSFGQPFNQHGGGVFAMVWNVTRISSYYFPRSNIPSDLLHSSTIADPTRWGIPVAFWDLGSNCPYTHFHNMEMIFDMTFCGDFAGARFPSDCPGKGSCDTFVKDNPTYFTQAFWSINFVKILSQI